MPLGGKKKRLNEKIQLHANPGKVGEVGNSKVRNCAIFGEQLFFSAHYSFTRMTALFLFPSRLVEISS